jgi:hypothetical protein
MNVLYIDQTGQLGGGELSLFDWLKVSPQNTQVVLFEDGPFRPMLEELGIPVKVLPLAGLNEVRRESGLLKLASRLPALLSLRKRLAGAALLTRRRSSWLHLRAVLANLWFGTLETY